MRRTVLLSSLFCLATWSVHALAATVPAQEKADPPPSPCSAPEARQFDFWIGEWEIDQKILEADGSWLELKATTKVTPALGGCALVEHWEGEVQFFWEGMKRPVPLRGLSVRAFDPKSGQWTINWMDTRTPRFGGAYEGTFTDGRGEFFRAGTRPDGTPFVSRITFSEITPTSVRWDLSISTDDRKTWRPLWIMEMKRT